MDIKKAGRRVSLFYVHTAHPVIRMIQKHLSICGYLYLTKLFKSVSALILSMMVHTNL